MEKKEEIVDGEVVDTSTGEIQNAKENMDTTLAKRVPQPSVKDLTPEEINAVETALLNNNYALLSQAQRAMVIQKKCEAMGVSIWLQPYTWGTIDKKLVPVPNKSLFQQLRDNRKMTIVDIQEEWKEAQGILIVRVYGRVGHRLDMDLGVVSIKGLSGESLANEVMTAYTKGKNRLTASMCGGDAGPSDAEVPTISGAYLGEEKPDSIKTIQPGVGGERNRTTFTQIPQSGVSDVARVYAAGPSAAPPVGAAEMGAGKMQPPSTIPEQANPAPMPTFMQDEMAPRPAPAVSAPPTPAPIKVGTSKPQPQPQAPGSDKPKIIKAT